MKYQEYEFRKAVNCIELTKRPYVEGEFICCLETMTSTKGKCKRTAKEFHKWLNENGFIILCKKNS